MSKIKLGEVEWNDADLSSGKSGKTDFMRLQEGLNVLRVMAPPIQYYINWLELKDGSRRKVNTPIESPEVCQMLEDAGFKRQAHWLLRVLDRGDEQFKLLEIGPQIFKGVKDLVDNRKWGPVTAYDITIKKAPKGTNPLYAVSPDPKEALPKKLETEWHKFNEGLNIERLVSPSDAEFVCNLMGWKVPQSKAQNSDDSDESFDFE